MSNKEKLYFDKIYANDDALFEGTMNEQLMNEIVSDKELTKEQKESLCVFISTMQASSEYWIANYNDWLTLINRPQLKRWTYRQKSIFFADTWWAWYGTLGSGGNFAIGGIAGLAASCLAAVNYERAIEEVVSIPLDDRIEYNILDTEEWIIPPSGRIRQALEAQLPESINY